MYAFQRRIHREEPHRCWCRRVCRTRTTSLRGIEIYNGRPIFYSVGNCIMDDLRTPVGADMFEFYEKDPMVDTDADVTAIEMSRGYETDLGFTEPFFYESFIPVSRFEQNALAEIRLYPIELGHSKRFAGRGIPRRPMIKQANSTLQRCASCRRSSAPRSRSETGLE